MPSRDVQDFIAHWSAASASERANSQPFLLELCDLLGVPRPDPHPDKGYFFEFPIVEQHPDGTTSNGRIDLYRRAHFVLESKQFQEQKAEASQLELAAQEAGVVTRKKSSQPVRGTGAWDDAMMKARGQAERYVRAIPDDNPPFIIVVDVGHSFEIYADFSQAGKAYLPFPDPRTFRIRLADLADEKIRERLRLIWTDPAALDPAKRSADVTREVSGHLAELAKSLEQAGHEPDIVAQFLTRCLFCMFAEDVELLPKDSFTDLLESLPANGEGFEDVMRQLFREMNTGTGKGISVVLRKKLLHFNGGLFADDTVLPINGLQLGLLKEAARQNWGNVEPAIFGTLLERALNPNERHQLGAHYTPRAYVERLVLPTVIEPLRSEWENVRAAALTKARAGDLKKARAEVNEFHERLCKVTVLDPACGSGNFLYVALQHLKVLEGEVFDVAAQFGDTFRLELERQTVDPHQFLGIEINPRAASIAELVLWIGYLQWHFRLHGKRTPPEPILRAFKNIQCRDAVLEYDGEPQPARDDAGKEITVWDRRSKKTDIVTGREVPDETKRVPLLTYKNPRQAQWPSADYIVGNPPFIGTVRMREDLGDGYAETLRATYPAVPETADFVLYWWHKAAELTRAGKVKRFGLITTNSLRQTFARRVVQAQLSAKPPLSLLFAIPDHPWVDTAEGAAVRIAMTVGTAGEQSGELLEVTGEEPQPDGSEKVSFKSQPGKISAELTTGADVSSAVSLNANGGLSCPGVKLHGSGFIVTPEEAKGLGLGKIKSLERIIRPYRNGKDLNDAPRGVMVIDLFGLTVNEVRENFPAVYQHVLTRVKPERDTNNRATYRDNWWIFGEPRRDFRPALADIGRYIATTETSKHRFFQFLDAEILPDNMVIAIALDDAFYLGILNSRIHVVFSLTAGGRLGVGNDPRYNKSRCFDPFPFPICGEPEKKTIRKFAEELDAHRKRAQDQHGLTLTGLYNVLEKIRAGEKLTDKEKVIHDAGLVSVLKQLHDDLDAAVFAAYGWPATLTDAEILERLVALNAERAAEEKRGVIHWLRPDYQTKLNPGVTLPAELPFSLDKKSKKAKATAHKPKGKESWPKKMAERVQVVEAVLHRVGTATPAELAAQIKRAKPADVAEILETLVTMGRARQHGEKFSR
jgi:type I restriction-modification system DNA methylase subunit